MRRPTRSGSVHRMGRRAVLIVGCLAFGASACSAGAPGSVGPAPSTAESTAESTFESTLSSFMIFGLAALAVSAALKQQESPRQA